MTDKSRYVYALGLTKELTVAVETKEEALEILTLVTTQLSTGWHEPQKES
jgi:hypothetical protein